MKQQIVASNKDSDVQVSTLLKAGSSAKVNQKYQITIPRELRKKWHVNPGDTIILVREDIGVRMETFEDYLNKYKGLLAGKGHSVRDLKETRKTMFLR